MPTLTPSRIAWAKAQTERYAQPAHLGSMHPMSDEFAAQFLAHVAEFMAGRPEVEQPTAREVTGPHPIVLALPERMPQPYLLVKEQS